MLQEWLWDKWHMTALQWPHSKLDMCWNRSILSQSKSRQFPRALGVPSSPPSRAAAFHSSLRCEGTVTDITLQNILCNDEDMNLKCIEIMVRFRHHSWQPTQPYLSCLALVRGTFKCCADRNRQDFSRCKIDPPWSYWGGKMGKMNLGCCGSKTWQNIETVLKKVCFRIILSVT